jgi:hypothetical protein
MEFLRNKNAEGIYKEQDNIKVTVAIYKHQDWQTLLDMKNPTCKEKEELAFRLDRPRIPLNGKEIESWVTKTERNWFHPQMYLMVVMDCDEMVQKIVGENRHGRLEIRATMTSDDDHFSYEKQGSVGIDTFLLLSFIGLIAFQCYDYNKFTLNFETNNSPHAYCIIAMAF